MPTKPKRPCTHPGCPELVTTGRCTVHLAAGVAQRKADGQRYDKTRGTATSRGYNSQWARYSKQYRKDNPLCVDCLAKGILTSVEHGGHVDHIQAVTGPDDPRFWDKGNWQSLCHKCHSAKTARVDRGYGNRKGWVH